MRSREISILLYIPSGPSDVQWTSLEPPYRTSGRPKGTFNGRLVDLPNETQLAHPNRAKMDVHFRPSRDAVHGTCTSSGPSLFHPARCPLDVYWTPTRCHMCLVWYLDVLLDLYQTSYSTNIVKYPISSFSNFWLEL